MRNQNYALSNSEKSSDADTSGININYITRPESFSELKGDKLISCFSMESQDEIINLSEQTIKLGDIILPIFRYPERQHLQNHMISLQKWQGYVTGIEKGSIFVRLVDLTRKGPEEETEIPLEEISEEDKKLIEPGAVFYWNIGYMDSYNGQRTRVSVIRFQRLPKWSKEEINAAKQRAERFAEIFDWQ